MQKNGELLYLYDARLCNPNGDPDEENKPRMDYETGRNLVSDVRLKRYLRDYWLSLSEDGWKRLGYDPKPDVWVRQLEDENGNTVRVSAKQRIDGLAKEFAREKGKDYTSAKKAAEDPGFTWWLLERLIDARLFGAKIPIGEGEGERGGASLTLTGPVQLSWGYSLNRVEILPSATISSQFKGREETEAGTFGKDWRVKYSLLAFYGVISAWRARRTGLTERDVLLLDHSLIEALPLLATTRSKLGQTPRLYLRVQYRDDRTLLGDLRAGLSLKCEEGLEGIDDVELDFTGLVRRLERAEDRIEKVVFWRHPDFFPGEGLEDALKETFGDRAVLGVQPPRAT
ncbi:MAG: type I-B CRISPR-associated protein Cas7/Csh2 [Thermoprotei archaeon]|nr:MAG: type I-B CRISPR-associated protein Cas7/Csh2 [Thermoprotei archaeon]